MVLLKKFIFNFVCDILMYCDPPFQKPEIRTLDRVSIRSEVNLTISTNSGPLEGHIMQTMGGRDIFAFEGIPYAEPPIGNKRFKPPVSIKPWRDIQDAKKPGPYCLQLNLNKFVRVIGSLDCLYLNVYSPQLEESNTKYPVIVYIHGGSFIMGAGHEYGPTYMLDQNLVLVTINYRLGAEGFLSTGDEESPGNYGLKDQAEALKWVHNNIQFFGGDPKKVTIMGQSAGAASVHCHLLSNKTRGYFNSGVSLSGSAHVHWGFNNKFQAKRFTNKLAKVLNCPTTNSKALMNCIKNQEPSKLAEKQRKIMDYFPFPPALFAPTIEAQSETAFLTETPDESYERNNVAQKPWISTMVEDEGHYGLMVLYMLGKFPFVKLNWDNVGKYILDIDYLGNDTRSLLKKITKFYMKNDSPVAADEKIYSKMLTDRYFAYGIHKSLQAHSQIAPTYSYLFTFKGNYNVGNVAGFTSQDWGVGHSEDLYYYFNSSLNYNGFKFQDSDYKMSKIMIEFLKNFAYTGIPYHKNEKGEFVNIWNNIKNPINMSFLRMDKSIKMIEEPFIDRLKFWESLSLSDTKWWIKII